MAILTKKCSLPDLRDFLRDHLLTSIMPFWTEHAIDPKGGISNCISRDGVVLSRDKWIWSQWRAVYVFSKLYNSIEQRPEWLRIAQHICDFTSKYAWDENARGWVVRVSGDGEILDSCNSIYSDGFAIYALAELARATNDEATIALARKTADIVLEKFETIPPDKIPHEPYPIPPGFKMHGVPMIFCLVFWELGQLLNEQRYLDAAVAMTDEIFTHFYRPDRDVILERICLDNSEGAPPNGTTVNPGHVIEDMWFQIHIARDRGDTERIANACDLILRHLEVGWDDEYGGILLAVDAGGREEVGWGLADAKAWWPHTEAMYSLLLGYEHTHDDRFLDWYWRVHEYTFSHFPDEEHGEWKQSLTREGTPSDEVLAIPAQDPFHLPRALIYCIETLERMTSTAG